MAGERSMKVVVINGSPRRGGVVSQMLGHVVAALPQDCTVESLTVCDLRVRPCTGCMRCRSLGRCVLPEDDAHRVAGMIRACDALVVGSPCYWGNMSGELKVLFDRMVYALMGERENGLPVALHKGKRAVLVSACNTVWPSASGSARRAACSVRCARFCAGAGSASWGPSARADAANTGS